MQYFIALKLPIYFIYTTIIVIYISTERQLNLRNALNQTSQKFLLLDPLEHRYFNIQFLFKVKIINETGFFVL